MKYLKLFLKERKGKVGITLIMLLGQAVGTLLIPFLIAGIVDNGILKGDMNEILNIGGQMLLVLLITTVAAVLGSFSVRVRSYLFMTLTLLEFLL